MPSARNFSFTSIFRNSTGYHMKLVFTIKNTQLLTLYFNFACFAFQGGAGDERCKFTVQSHRTAIKV